MTPREQFEKKKGTPEKEIVEKTKQGLFDKFRNFEFNNFQINDLLDIFKENANKNINNGLTECLENFKFELSHEEKILIGRMIKNEFEEMKNILKEKNEEE